MRQSQLFLAALSSVTILLIAIGPSDSYAAYQLPSDRQITWNGSAGLDPVGGIPSAGWTVTNCSVVADGTTNQHTQVQACINAAGANTVVELPCGPILVSGANLSMKSNVVLRGCAPLPSGGPYLPTANPAVTTLIMGTNLISFSGGSKGANWTPGAQQGYAITAGYAKDSTQITATGASGNIKTGDWIAIYQNEDTSLMDWKGELYLGEDCSCSASHAWQQYSKVTNASGDILTISPAIYGVSPAPTGQAVRKQTFGIKNAGLEDLRVQGNSSHHNVLLSFAQYCWIKDIESYSVGNGSGDGSSHIRMEFSDGIEVRDSFIHEGGVFTSGNNYGITMYFWNSAHKIENNVIWHTRHSIIFAGGGSGVAVLYNYSFDNHEAENTSFLSQDCTPDHGANPMFNLWEGNYCQQFYADYTHGSSSYNTLFRNYAIAYRTTPTPTTNFTAFRIGPFSRYYNLLGNVAGRSAWTSGTAVCDSGSCSFPRGYEFGVHTNGSYLDSQSKSTSLNHGNFDYVTDGVALWEGGADHTLPASLYYTSKPAFFGSSAWPPFGSDLSPIINRLPAQDRYEGTAQLAPAAPTNLTAQ